MPRYEDSPRGRYSSPDRRSKSPRGYRGGGHRGERSKSPGSPPPPSTSRRDDGRSYRILCVSNITHRASDSSVKDALLQQFKKFGDVDVKLSYDHEGNDRVAFIYFTSSTDARDARYARAKMSLFDKPVTVEPVYPEVDRAHRRSPSLEYYRSRSRGRSSRSRSPTRRHRSSLEGYLPPPLPPLPPHLLPPHGLPPPLPHELLWRDRPPMPPFVPPRDFFPLHYPPRFHHPFDKKDRKFPDYLIHIPPEDDEKANRTLFIGNLDVNIPEIEVRRIFERYGVIEDIDIKRPPPGQGNAYAFIKYVNLDMAHRAKVEMSGQYIAKFQCKIGYGKAVPTTRLWVGGLGSWTSLTQLEREFDRFGAIKKIDYVKGDDHAYILYDSIDAAQAACKEMRGSPLGGPDKRLKVDFASPPGAFTYPKVGSSEEISAEYRPHSGPPPFYRSSREREYPPWPMGYPPYYGARPGEWPGYDPRDLRSWKGPLDELDRKRPRSPSDNTNPYKYRRSSKSPDPPGGEWDRRKSSSPDGRRRSSERDQSPGKDKRYGSDNEGNKDWDGVRNGAGNGPVSAEHAKATNLQELMQALTESWHGALVLKNSCFTAKMFICEGSANLVETMMKDGTDNPMLRITQRLRLDQPKLDDVTKRMGLVGPAGYCILLSVAWQPPANSDETNTSVQQRPLRNLVTYLKQKEAAGVIALPCTKDETDNKDATGVLYAFPPCDFARDLLKRTATNLTDEGIREDHLVVVVVKGSV